MAYVPEEFRQRPRDFDPRLADLIIERVLNGEGLTEICEDRDYPMAGTFLQWISRDPHLAEQYAEAQRIRTDLMVDEMIEISKGYNTQHARNRLDAHKFHAERLMPEKYGPRSHVTQRSTDEKTDAGIDYGAEVRRKLEAISQRQAAAATEAETSADKS